MFVNNQNAFIHRKLSCCTWLIQTWLLSLIKAVVQVKLQVPENVFSDGPDARVQDKSVNRTREMFYVSESQKTTTNKQTNIAFCKNLMREIPEHYYSTNTNRASNVSNYTSEKLYSLIINQQCKPKGKMRSNWFSQ